MNNEVDDSSSVWNKSENSNHETRLNTGSRRAYPGSEYSSLLNIGMITVRGITLNF